MICHMLATTQQRHARGDELILRHCAALARLHGPQTAPLERLEAIVGPEFASLLVHGLTTVGRRPPVL